MTSNNQEGNSLLRQASPAVPAGELRSDWYDDAELSDQLRKDCEQLLAEAESNFREVKDQQWYTRLWKTMSGKNTQQAAKNAATLAQAQQMLLEVMTAHANTSNRSHALLAVLCRDLRRLGHQQGQVTEALIQMCERVVLLEKEVAAHRHRLNPDMSDVRAWQDEQKLLLFKAMAAAALADQKIVEDERQLLDHKLQELSLTPESHKDAGSYLSAPYDIRPELQRIESYRARRSIYRHVVAVLYADRRLVWRERRFLNRIGKVLELRGEEASAIVREFEDARHDLDHAMILSLLAPLGAHTQACTAADVRTLEHSQSLREEVDRERELGRQQVRALLAGVREVWCQAAAQEIALSITNPIDQRIDEYPELEGTPSASEIVNPLDPEEIRRELASIRSDARRFARQWLTDVDRHLPLPETLHEQFDATWSAVLADDGGVDDALKMIYESGTGVVESEPSTAGAIVRGAGLGFIGGMFAGPIGVGVAVGVASWLGGDSDDRYSQSVDTWWQAVETLGAAADRWEKSIASRFEGLFGEICDYIDHAAEEAQMLEPVIAVVGQLNSDLDECGRHE